MDPAVRAAIDDHVAFGEIGRDAPIGQIRDLVVRHGRGLDGLQQCTGLRTLSLIGCEQIDLRLLAPLPALELLAVEFSTLRDRDLEALRDLPLLALVLRGTTELDIGALRRMPRLTMVTVRGVPIEPAALSWLRWDLAERAVVQADEDEAWRLCRAIAEQDLPATVYTDDRGRLRAAWLGLSRTGVPEAGHPVVTVDAVERSLAQGRALGDLLP